MDTFCENCRVVLVCADPLRLGPLLGRVGGLTELVFRQIVVPAKGVEEPVEERDAVP